MFALRSKDNRYEITTYSIEYLNKILQIAGSNRKLGETRACLEGKSLEACQSPGKGINYTNFLNFYRINVDVLYIEYPLRRENGGKKIPVRENREFGNFAKTQRIWFAQVVNSLILKVKYISIFATKISTFFL